MSKRVIRNKKKKADVVKSPFNIYWDKQNYILLFAGIAVLILGFFLMSVGKWNSFTSLFISPFVIMIGYLLLIPASILHKEKNKEQKTQE